MNLDKKSFANAKHILIITDNGAFANASALYSYVLTLHKKVSIHKTGDIERKFSFLAWFDKLRAETPSYADFIIEVSSDIKSLFNFFIVNEIKINKKMATALYGALLIRYESFMSEECDAGVFAMASELIHLGAEYKLCNDKITHSLSLAHFRLKAIMLQSMLLTENASCANLYITDNDLKASGATLNDAVHVMKECLHLVHIKCVILYKNQIKERKIEK